MKKILAILMAAVLVFGLVACGKGGSSKEPGPEDTVSAFCDALNDLDFSKMKACLKSGDLADDLNMDDVPEEFLDMIRTWAKEIRYKVGTPETKGSDSKVRVDFTYVDAASVIREALTQYVTRAIAAALGGDTSEEAMTKILIDCLKEAQKSVKTGTKEAGVDFYLEQADGKWLIKDAPEEIVRILLANMLESFESFFGGLEDD